MVYTCVCSLSHVLDGYFYRAFLNKISVDRVEQINLCPNLFRKKVKLYSEILLRIMIIQLLNISNDCIRFGRLKNGKPILCDNDNCKFNISHSGNIIAVAITLSDSDIGLDVEKDLIVNYGIVKRFFGEKERYYVSESKSTENNRFCEIWTRKEAYIKYLGVGLKGLSLADTFQSHIYNKIISFHISDFWLSLCSDSDAGIVRMVKEEEINKKFLNIIKENEK